MSKDTEVTKQVENALTAFSAVKDMVTGFDTKLKDVTTKLDAFDQASFQRMEKAVNDGIEASHKADSRQKAVEEGQKEQQKQLDQIVAALNRVNPGSTEQDAKRIAKKAKKLFNDFARLDSGNSSMYFDEFVKLA